MTELLYLSDSYRKECEAHVLSFRKSGSLTDIILNQTVFYPEGGGQPSDIGEIVGKNFTAKVKHVRLDHSGNVIHEAKIDGEIKLNDQVKCLINWEVRFRNMQVHSGGHIVHEAVLQICPNLIPIRANHGKNPFIQYSGTITVDKELLIEKAANDIVSANLPISADIVTYAELVEKAGFVPEHLPKNKPLRIVTIGNFKPVPDGGTQVKNSQEVGNITISAIKNEEDAVTVFYSVKQNQRSKSENDLSQADLTASEMISNLIQWQQDVLKVIEDSQIDPETLKREIFSRDSEFSKITSRLKSIPVEDKARVGLVVKEVKNTIENAIGKMSVESKQVVSSTFDTTLPGVRPPEGHLHIVTQAINEITRIFERIGFTRVRHPEVDWDYYAFEALNMPPEHPARDEWETFHIKSQITNHKKQTNKNNSKFRKIVLTPHTSNGQVREMEKGKLPIRMINIAKCYRRQSDVSHAPMFHQFEGLYVDKNVSIAHLKGVCDYFFKQFYGPGRTSRLRPFHFQFTEPSFEIDVSCGLCGGKGVLENGQTCRMCKEGWLELGGAGMVHPNVLKAGNIDPDVYSGFAFGWGVERTYMMKSGISIDDIRILYENDMRFLEQF